MRLKKISAFVFVLMLTLFLMGGCLMAGEVQQQESRARYFSSPEAAVSIITSLLEDENFKILAAYYDLSGSGINRAELESGDFFIRKERPEAAHPAGLWRYKHPFAPGFKYSHVSSGPEKNIYAIHVKIEIEQGTGVPSQVGYDAFNMIQSAQGWRILPSRAKKEEAVELPAMSPQPMPDPARNKQGIQKRH